MLAALGDRRTAWTDRFLFTPITGWTLPQLVSRGVPAWGGDGCGGDGRRRRGRAAGCSAMPAAGLAVSLLSIAALSTGSMLSWLRGEDGWRARRSG